MLYHDFLTNEQRRIHKVPHYFPIYERHFSKFQNQSIVFWEIGVAGGGSLQMWQRYFGSFATIVGIDINPECKQYEENEIKVCIGDQKDKGFLQSVIAQYGAPDIVLDDGSHIMSDIRQTFEFMYDKLSKNGVYFIEDLCTAYWDSHEGGLRREGSIIELSKDLVDSLNARHSNLPLAFAESTFSICFYDSIVVFEKKAWPKDMYRTVITPEKFREN